MADTSHETDDFGASREVIEFMKKQGDDADGPLSNSQKAMSGALTRLVQSDLEPATLYSAWVETEGYREYRVRRNQLRCLSLWSRLDCKMVLCISWKWVIALNDCPLGMWEACSQIYIHCYNSNFTIAWLAESICRRITIPFESLGTLGEEIQHQKVSEEHDSWPGSLQLTWLSSELLSTHYWSTYRCWLWKLTWAKSTTW